MIRRTTLALFSAALLGFTPTLAVADDDLYSVTITNITPGQLLTPALVFSHDGAAMPFFMGGQPASMELEKLAEGGMTMPLLHKMMAAGVVTDYASVGGLIGPGESATVMLMADEHGYIGLGSMLLPTNDGFIGANGIPVPDDEGASSVLLPAMDAGTEDNDELLMHIPGPFGGEAVSAMGGEGFVHVHSGIHGVGDLMAPKTDWNNPVVKVTVKRVNN